MSGEIFSCPICGNFSQYVDPQNKVFGQEKPSGNVGMEDYTKNHSSEPPAVSVPTDSSKRENAGEREYYPKLKNDGRTMTEEDLRSSARTIFQQREMLEAIQRENEAKNRNVRRQAGSSTRHVEKLADDVEDKAKIESSASFDEEHLLKLRNDYYPEDCQIHKESTNFLCVNCELKLCAQCGSEHNLSYKSHRIEDMGAFSTRDRNDGKYAGNDSLPSTEPSPEAKTTKQCPDHQFPFILYCKKCQTLLCRVCNEKHDRHYLNQPVALRDMQKEVFTKFERYFDEINPKKRKYTEVSGKAAVNIQQVYEQADVLKQKVNTATQQVMDQLRENAEVMIRQIDSEAEKVTAKHRAQTESADKNIKTLDEVVDLVQNALKNARDSEFLVADIAEGEIDRRMRSLDTPHLSMHAESNQIYLECQVNKRLNYSEHEGELSCAPVRLVKSQYTATTFVRADSIWFQRM